MAKKKDKGIHFDHETSQFVGLTDVDLKRLREIYPNVNVEREIQKMTLWMLSAKGRRRKGDVNFIMNWLKNAAATSYDGTMFLKKDNEVDRPPTQYEDYLKDLWKNREHILTLNTMIR